MYTQVQRKPYTFVPANLLQIEVKAQEKEQ